MGLGVAVAGGACSAYLFSIERGALTCSGTTYPRARCLSPAEASAQLAQGFPVLVAGTDVFAFRALWEREQEERAAQ